MFLVIIYSSRGKHSINWKAIYIWICQDTYIFYNISQFIKIIIFLFNRNHGTVLHLTVNAIAIIVVGSISTWRNTLFLFMWSGKMECGGEYRYTTKCLNTKFYAIIHSTSFYPLSKFHTVKKIDGRRSRGRSPCRWSDAVSDITGVPNINALR